MSKIDENKYNNRYIDFIIGLFDFISTNKLEFNPKRCLGSSLRYSSIDLPEELKKTLWVIKEIYTDKKDLNKMDLFTNIKLFGIFIRYVEKCFMVINDDNRSIYSEESKDDNKFFVYFKFDNFKVKFIFESTVISKSKNSNVALSMLEGYLSSEKEVNEFVEFINIDIVREYGKQMMNSFKFINGENISLSDSDTIMLKNLLVLIDREIIKSFNEIVNFVLQSYTNINCEINFEDEGISYISESLIH